MEYEKKKKKKYESSWPESRMPDRSLLNDRWVRCYCICSSSSPTRRDCELRLADSRIAGEKKDFGYLGSRYRQRRRSERFISSLSMRVSGSSVHPFVCKFFLPQLVPLRPLAEFSHPLDPKYPKVQFLTAQSSRQCYRSSRHQCTFLESEVGPGSEAVSFVIAG